MTKTCYEIGNKLTNAKEKIEKSGKKFQKVKFEWSGLIYREVACLELGDPTSVDPD